MIITSKAMAWGKTPHATLFLLFKYNSLYKDFFRLSTVILPLFGSKYGHPLPSVALRGC